MNEREALDEMKKLVTAIQNIDSIMIDECANSVAQGYLLRAQREMNAQLRHIIQDLFLSDDENNIRHQGIPF